MLLDFNVKMVEDIIKMVINEIKNTTSTTSSKIDVIGLLEWEQHKMQYKEYENCKKKEKIRS